MPKGYSIRNQSGWKHKKDSILVMSLNRTGKCLMSNNVRWKDKDVSYHALHYWVRRNFIKPDICDFCKKNPGLDNHGRTKLHWANKTDLPIRERDNWLCLCSSCHKKYDIDKKSKK